MKITVIGASAGVGLEVVKRALFRGHQVTALSRSGLPLPAHQKLTSILGNALKKMIYKTPYKEQTQSSLL